MKIFVTGSNGLIGSTLCKLIEDRVERLYKVDTKSTLLSEKVSFFDPYIKNNILNKVDGVIHLAGCSRIPFAVQHPSICWQENAIGTMNLVKMIMAQRNRPWLIYASSREVYGDQEKLPVAEEAPYKPLNIYAESKIFAENTINAAIKAGLRAEIIRFSNVYGSIYDYNDRVIPAFSYAALNNASLNVIGKNCTFDFTFVDDVADGIYQLAQRLDKMQPLIGPLHFTSGVGTTLGKLAQIIVGLTQSRALINYQPPRKFGASCFVGDPLKAKSLLRWQASTALASGINQFLERIHSNNNKTVETKMIAV